MAYILSIETATPVCAVAIHNEGNLMGETRLLQDKSHSGKLAVLIKNLLEELSLEMKELSAIAVSKGPGSYTGLRIGVSTAKGLCYGLKIPLIGINSLTALAAQVKPFIFTGDLLLPMFDARRMEVYSQVLDENLNILQDTTPVVVEEKSYGNFLSQNRVFIFGDGSHKCKPVLNHPNAIYVNDVYPSACSVGDLAYLKYLKEEFEDVAYFEPYYLKEFRAGTPKSLV